MVKIERVIPLFEFELKQNQKEIRGMSKRIDTDFTQYARAQGEPLVCAFQRQFNAPYRIQCALTGIGTVGGAISRVFANYEPCKIDICPQFQNMRMNKKIVSWLEMEK